jgi:anti-sigma factor RsiW
VDDADRALLAAAATGRLDDDERARLDALLARDPAAASELAELRGVLDALEPLRDPAAAWREQPPPPLPAAPGPPGRSAPPGPSAQPAPAVLLPRQRSSGRRTAALALAACLLLAVGGVGGALVRGALDERGRPAVVVGPPGTLGAVEEVSTRTSDGVGATASVVAHTWGTETVLDLSGLERGRTYQVVVVDEAGRAVVAGTVLGTGGAIDCTMNAAVLRADASRVQVLDPAGTAVVDAELPPVSA